MRFKGGLFMSDYYDDVCPNCGRSQDNFSRDSFSQDNFSSNDDFSLFDNLRFDRDLASQSTLSCPEYLNNALHALFCNRFKGLFKSSSFTLYTLFTQTAQDATTIKSLPSCIEELLEFSEGGNSKFASLCNLTGFSFLLNDSSNDLGRLISAIKDWLSTCQYPRHTSCNKGKAERLCNSLSPVTLQVAGPIDTLTDVTVLEVAENAVWVAKKLPCPPHHTYTDDKPDHCKPDHCKPPCPPHHCHKITVYVICLDDIEFIS